MKFSLVKFYLMAAFVAFSAFGKSPADDKATIKQYKDECLRIKKFVVKGQYGVSCFSNYHHFNNKSSSRFYRPANAKKAKRVRMASYNLWHPGSLNTVYKDLKLVAKIINKWDIVTALELLPVVGRNSHHNENVLTFLSKEGPDLINELRGKLDGAKSNKRRNAYLDEIMSIQNDMQIARNLYRGPAYLKILDELMKLDPSWSLIISPRGDSFSASGVQEVVGFFYRGKRVRPIVNEHCLENKKAGDGNPIACLPNLGKSFMGRNTNNAFSRRPFLASFESGNFDFSLLGAHIVFGSPRKKDDIKSIMNTAFGFERYQDLGRGVNKKNYARFAEVRLISEFMSNLRKKYSEKDIILGADFNLEIGEAAINDSIAALPGAELFGVKKSTLSERKVTGGLVNSYDHFLLDFNKTSECFGEVKTLSYFSGVINAQIKQRYLIRNARGQMTAAGEKRMNAFIAQYAKMLKKVQTIKHGKIVWDNALYESKLRNLKRRVFDDQLRDNTYFRVFKEVLSDHLPISMDCSNNARDDD